MSSDRAQKAPSETPRGQTCRHCFSPLHHQKTKICPQCGRDQRRLFHIVKAVNLVSVGLLILAAMQFYEARQERIKAEEATTRIVKMEGDFKRVAKAFVENNLISSEVRLTWAESNSSPRLQRFDKNVDELARFIEPDDSKRKQWIESALSNEK